ncbi:MAG: hypothetical protein NTV50_06245 [Planctomycetota bacterium]|nr:hypothetical protein [Planctomycetota bacterium]
MLDETIIDLKDIPPVVRNKANLVFDKMKWLSAVKVQNDDSKIAYELDGINNGKDEVTVTITNAGKMVEYDVFLSDPTTMPSKILEAVKMKWAGFILDEAHLNCLGEDIENQKDGERLYNLSGKRHKKNVQAQVSSDGEILEFVNEWDLDKVPKIVSDALDKAKPGVFKADAVYAINEKNKIIGFKFEGKGPKGLSKCFFVTPDGKRVERVEE